MLYDTIEELDTAIMKLNYILQAHKAYTAELLEDYCLDKSLVLKPLNGIETVNNDLVKEFELIAEKFTVILKEE
jgi:hypothetical protein